MTSATPPEKPVLRVLVVEDKDDDFEMLRLELVKAYDVVARRVETAEAMDEALDSQSWDVVVSDWCLPRFSGPEALERLRSRKVDVPIMVVSGTVGEDAAVEAMRLGAHDFMAKGKLSRLLPAISRELRESRMRRERTKMQEQLLVSDRMASVGILAAGVAHEINNPLAAVLANVELAHAAVTGLARAGLHTPEVEEVVEELSEARDAAHRIREIVRDLKLFSRSGDEEQRYAVDVRRVLESSLRMAWNEIRHRARLVKEYEVVPAVWANEARLGQVFLNLIVNAAQAIPEGRSGTNEIRVRTCLAPGGHVVVEISDTGSGMAPDVLKRLFTPFFTTKPVGAGTGLGLSICHRIVTSLGGEIGVESTLGRGATFRVRLPASPEVVASAPPPAGTPLPPARRGRVLAIDDEPLITRAVLRTLEKEHDVFVVNRAQEALDMIVAGERFDIIFCDLMMPDITGMDLYERTRKLDEKEAEKIVFLTGGAFTSRARAFLDEVPNLRLEKPFDPVALRAIVHERVR